MVQNIYYRAWLDTTTGEQIAMWDISYRKIWIRFCDHIPKEDRKNWIELPEKDAEKFAKGD